MIKILANENFPLKSVHLLKDAGFDISAISKKYPGISDEEVMKIADTEQRIIVTFDSDYGELIFRHGYKPNAGVIYFRWNEFTPDEPGKYLVKIFKSGKIDTKKALTVIDTNSIRQRKY